MYSNRLMFSCTCGHLQMTVKTYFQYLKAHEDFFYKRCRNDFFECKLFYGASEVNTWAATKEPFTNAAEMFMKTASNAHEIKTVEASIFITLQNICEKYIQSLSVPTLVSVDLASACFLECCSPMLGLPLAHVKYKAFPCDSYYEAEYIDV